MRADVQYKFDWPTNELLFADFKESFDALTSLDRLLLRHRGTAPLAE